MRSHAKAKRYIICRAWGRKVDYFRLRPKSWLDKPDPWRKARNLKKSWKSLGFRGTWFQGVPFPFFFSKTGMLDPLTWHHALIRSSRKALVSLSSLFCRFFSTESSVRVFVQNCTLSGTEEKHVWQRRTEGHRLERFTHLLVKVVGSINEKEAKGHPLNPWTHTWIYTHTYTYMICILETSSLTGKAWPRDDHGANAVKASRGGKPLWTFIFFILITICFLYFWMSTMSCDNGNDLRRLGFWCMTG